MNALAMVSTPNTTNSIAAPWPIRRSGSCRRAIRPTATATASAATIPNVDPSQTEAHAGSLPAIETVASCVLSPSSERKNASATTPNVPSSGIRRTCVSSSLSVSPRRLHHAKPRNERPTAMRSGASGTTPSITRPMPTDPRCTISVAAVTPDSTTHHR